MNANSINRKGELLKMLLKVSDLSETKSIFIILNKKATQGFLMSMTNYKSLMQQDRAGSIIWLAIIILTPVT